MPAEFAECAVCKKWRWCPLNSRGGTHVKTNRLLNFIFVFGGKNSTTSLKLKFKFSFAFCLKYKWNFVIKFDVTFFGLRDEKFLLFLSWIRLLSIEIGDECK